MEHKYKFSIITSIYNVEEYLEESIDSILNQTIGFKENIQLILVNDGSPDNSEEICKRYQKQFPDNIVYVKKKNGGLASARNEGLKHVEGEYVNFFDPDDILPSNVLVEVYNFYKINRNFVNMVSIPLEIFGAYQALHGKYEFMGEKNRIINLKEEPYNFVLSSASSFYKVEVFDKLKFDENLRYSEDTHFNIQLYKNNLKIGYVCENGVKYLYRKREDSSSLVDLYRKNPDNFFLKLNILNTIDMDNLNECYSEIIIYELRNILRDITKEIFPKKDYDKILDSYVNILKHIPEDFVLYKSKWANQGDFKSLYLKLMNKKWEEKIFNKVLPIKININFKNYYVDNNKFIVELLFNNYGYNYLDVRAFDGDNQIYEPAISRDLESSYNAEYGEFKLDQTHYRKFEFDLTGKTIRFMLFDKKTKEYYPANTLIDNYNNKLYLHNMKFGLRSKGNIVRFSGYRFKITNYKHSNIKYLLVTLKTIIKDYHKACLLRLLSKERKKYILVNDRPEKAGDNGEALFKYIVKNKPELKKITYFVISKKSSDYKQLKKIGNVVNIGSLKHKFLQLNSKLIYSSHTHKLFYNAFDQDELVYYRDLFDYKFVWLQHGITKDDISKPANRLNTKADYVITATNNEYDEFVQEKYFFNKHNILLTGFSRFDLLNNEPQKIITLCPTWRSNLVGPILSTGINAPLKNFKQTDYYMNYAAILSDKKLNKLLNEKKFILKFILHPGMTCYLQDFKEFENKNIKVVGQQDVTYRDIFKESSLLITDYSSVFFDFAYLKKPEIYYQFDQKTFNKFHYKKGYFSYEKDGFGDVINDTTKLIDKIDYYFNNNFVMEEKYLQRVNKTFRYTDRNNCKRIYEEILKLEED